MYRKKRIIAIIPARSGSKGIKDKNIKRLNGKPLIDYTIRAASESKYIDYIFVSTDSKKYSKIASDCGANSFFLRPKELSNDSSKTIDSIIFTINKLKKYNLEFDTLVLLQPTSPLRNSFHIDEAIELFFKTNERGVASVNLTDVKIHLLRTINGCELEKINDGNSTIRRQDAINVYKVNGAIYVNSLRYLTDSTSFNDNPIGYIMPSKNSIDIDTIDDLINARKAIRYE
ncbi:MAG: acylneuraminate cytidylyltransferase family protein [Bacilli bacterium]|nr:acylneuraminate cytidylyltransferase family protein [Bacilli bacterium]